MWAGVEGWCWISPPGRSLLTGPLSITGPASPWSRPVSVTSKSCSAHSWPGLSPLKGSSKPCVGLILAIWNAHGLRCFFLEGRSPTWCLLTAMFGCPHCFPLVSQDHQAPTAKHSAKDRPIPSPMASLSRR